jgi:hypothetical protein
MSRKRKSVSYKEPLTDPSESDLDEFSFKDSTSKFNYVEEDALRIEIIPKQSFLEAMEMDEIITNNLPKSLTNLYLESFFPEDIKIYNPKKHPDLDENASSFLIKLRLVLENNARVSDVSREERFIDDMAIEIMKAVRYDDGKTLTMRPCSLKLVVGSRTFSASADREGRRGLEIIWIMQENKHIDDTRYSEGDIQLISCMIAACQTNYRFLKEIYPEKMMGIKIKGDEIYFYSMKMSEEYLKSLTKSTPQSKLEVTKYPSKKGLRISEPKDRKELLSYLWTMRNYSSKLKDEL